MLRAFVLSAVLFVAASAQASQFGHRIPVVNRLCQDAAHAAAPTDPALGIAKNLVVTGAVVAGVAVGFVAAAAHAKAKASK